MKIGKMPAIVPNSGDHVAAWGLHHVDGLEEFLRQVIGGDVRDADLRAVWAAVAGFVEAEYLLGAALLRRADRVGVADQPRRDVEADIAGGGVGDRAAPKTLVGLLGSCLIRDVEAEVGVGACLGGRERGSDRFDPEAGWTRFGFAVGFGCARGTVTPSRARPANKAARTAARRIIGWASPVALGSAMGRASCGVSHSGL